MKPYIVLAALAALAPHAAAQQQAARPHPADAAAAVPAAKHESAFTGYRGYREEPLAPWREVNDETARVGGHIGIVKAGRSAIGTAPGMTTPGASPATVAPSLSPGAVR